MSCNDPIIGWKSKIRNETGKRSIVFTVKDGLADFPVNIQCGRCAGCMLAKSREWAVRCAHEAQLYEANSFITLTYEKAPNDNGVDTLRPRDFVLFMKKLRKLKGAGLRFFQAGEYGELGRPHHHCLLFNCDFVDKYIWTRRHYGNVYRSETLEKTWQHGFCEIGEVNFESAGYVARYTMKKIGSEIDQFGRRRIASYLTMSRRPGIGAGWYKKFKGDVFPSDEIVLSGGRRTRPPRFYDDRLEKEDPVLRKELQLQRVRSIPDDVKNGIRSMAREKILRQRISMQLKRSL